MSSASAVESPSARLARAALRYMAERRLPPTPDQYRMAWRAVGGSVSISDSDAFSSAAPAANVPQLAALFNEVLQQLDRPLRNWTVARKKEALSRVLGSTGNDLQRLQERLSRLIDAWRQDVPSSAAAETPAAPDAQEPARPAATQEPATDRPVAVNGREHERQVISVLDAEGRQSTRLRRVLADMTSLLAVVCETVPKLVEEEAWVRQQFDAVRTALTPASGVPDRRDLAQAADLLRRTAEEHQRLLKLRRDSLQMLKTMIAQCVEWLRSLTESSDRFGGKLSTYMDEIQRSPDLPALAGTVRLLIEDTRSMYREIDTSRRDFAGVSERARRLEDEVARLTDELRSTNAQVMTDHLTRLLNRRGLERSFEDLANRCRREGRKLSLALLDVDDFKKLNDALGHQAGDDALRHLADLLRGKLRSIDLSARYGGEEFIVLLPGVGGEDAAEIVRRLQRALTAEVFLHRAEKVFITFSAGVCEVGDDEPLTDVVTRADDAMYEAKRRGKNRVCLAESRAEARAELSAEA